MSNPKGVHYPSKKDLWNARDIFRQLLDKQTVEAEWQQFFSDHPFVFSMSLPLRLQPNDIMPLGKTGKTEPDFLFFPRSERPPSFYGVIELKRPDTKIVTVRRKNVAILTTDATAAIEQARSYARDTKVLDAIQRDENPLFLGNSMYLFVIMGMSEELTSKLAQQIYRDCIERQLPENLQLLPFDLLLNRFEAHIPERIQVLVPAMEFRTIQAVLSFEYYNDATKEQGAPACGTVHVSWDQAAAEWSEWEKGEFLEGYEQGSVVYLPYEKAKSPISPVSAKKLLELYGLNPAAIAIEHIGSMDPKALKTLAERQGAL